MRMLVPLVLWGLLGWVPGCVGQSSQGELESRLLHQPMYLRGLWQKDKLRFDGAGQLVVTSAKTSPLLCGVDVEKVEFKRGELLLTGKRMATVYRQEKPLWVDLKERVRLEIAAPANGDYGAALAAVLSPDLAGLAPAAPEFWQEFLVHGMEKPDKRHGPPAPMRKIGGGVMPPRVLHAPEPEFSDAARRMKVSGTILVYLQVGVDGLPSHLRILRPLGLGLDEKAVQAVQSYRFKPAMEGDTPVPVELNVEVTFHIF